MVRKILNEVFNYKNFRPDQEKIVNTILQGRDVFAVMPTGAGKSICFQLPALLFEGITIVLSPLISLMKDQVDSLHKLKIKATFLNQSLTTGKIKKTMNDTIKGRYKIIYIAPERLNSKGFFEFIRKIKISLVVVDEAHCVLQWGMGFRPSYLQIAQFFKNLNYRPTFAVFTATANSDSIVKITQLLKLKNPFVSISGFERKNLFFEVFKVNENYKINMLFKIFKIIKNESTIIYCQTQQIVECLFLIFLKKGFKATKYHAGLSHELRKRNQDKFLNGKVSVLIATNAFGMGIDKKDVRNVVHFNMPKSLEDYYQETGRAGRDGKFAKCFMIFSESDVEVNKFFIDNNKKENLTQEQFDWFRRKNYEKLENIVKYCRSDFCYRNQILSYFGEKLKNSEVCYFCGNCERNFFDCSFIAREIFRSLAEINKLVNTKIIIKILKGKWFLNKIYKNNKTFGKLKKVSIPTLKVCINQLIFKKYLTKVDGCFLKLTEKAVRFINVNNKTKIYLKTEEFKFNKLKYLKNLNQIDKKTT